MNFFVGFLSLMIIHKSSHSIRVHILKVTLVIDSSHNDTSNINNTTSPNSRQVQTSTYEFLKMKEKNRCGARLRAEKYDPKILENADQKNLTPRTLSPITSRHPRHLFLHSPRANHDPDSSAHSVVPS